MAVLRPMAISANKKTTLQAGTDYIPADVGGTGLNSYTLGDLIYASGATTLSKIAIGTTGQVLTVVGGVPTWATNSGSGSKSMANNTGVTIIAGSPVYVTSAGEIAPAQANASATATVFGLALADIADSTSGLVQFNEGTIVTLTTGEWDTICGTTGGLDEGVDYFLSAATAARLTATAPSTATQEWVLVGRGISTTEMKLVLDDPITL